MSVELLDIGIEVKDVCSSCQRLNFDVGSLSLVLGLKFCFIEKGKIVLHAWLLLDSCLRLFKTIPTGFPGSKTCIEGGSIQVRLPEGYVHVE